MSKGTREAALTVPVKELLPILTLLKAFTSERDIVPGLKHLWFKGDTICAHAGSAGAIWYTSWTFPGEFALPADMLTRTVGSLHDQGHEQVGLALRDASVGVHSGGFKASLARYKPSEGEDLSAYLTRDVPAKKGRVALERAWWGELERILFSVCKDETKAPLRGVFWADTGLLVSTDTFRISVLMPDKKVRALAPAKGGFLIPDHLLARLGGQRRDITGTVLEGETVQWLFFSAGAVYGSLVAGAFPARGCVDLVKKMRAEADAGGAWVTMPDGAPMLMVLDRLLYFAGAPTYRLDGAVTADATLHLRVAGEGSVPIAEEAIPAHVVGAPTTFAINGKYFRDAAENVGRRFWVPPAGGNAAYFVSDDKRFEHFIMLLGQ